MGHEVDVWSGQPYPELAPRATLVRVPSLDLWNEQALLRMPHLRELRDPINLAEWTRTMLGGFPEPRTFTQRVARAFDHMNGTARYDVVHDNQSLGFGLLRIRERFPVVATIHHPVTHDLRIALEAAPSLLRRYGLRRWYGFLAMQKRVARTLDRILTVSEASANDLAREYDIDRGRLAVVGNGINLDVFKPDRTVQRIPDRLITTLSADVPLKGFTFLVDALALLRHGRPSLTLTVIGSPERRSGTMKKIRRLGLESAVHFTGRVPVEEIARRYAESAVAVVASLYEGFGFPAGEAMACEVPVVSTRAGALPEVIGRDGACGILVAPGSGAELTRGVRQLLDLPAAARQRMGRAGRARVEEHFTWRRAAERTVDIYRAVIAERRTLRDGARSVAMSARLVAGTINGCFGESGRLLRSPGAPTDTARADHRA